MTTVICDFPPKTIRPASLSTDGQTHTPVSCSGVPGSTVVKDPPANPGDAGDVGSTPGWGRSPGEGNVTHSNILAWRTPWLEEPGGLHRVRHDSIDQTAAVPCSVRRPGQTP